MAEDGSRDLDQEWGEMTDELRVVLPGVQVLFAFLLTIPFSSRFSEVSGTDRALYFAAFVCAAVAAVLLIAPSVYHRLLWRQHDKEHMLQAAQRFAVTSSVFLAAATAAAVFLITDLLYGSTFGAGVAAGITTIIAVSWYARPLTRRQRR